MTDMTDETAPGGALVTGGARRIGRAIALDLARAGHAVAITYRGSADEAADVVRTIVSEGGRAAALKVDLSCQDAVAGCVAAAVDAVGPLRVLVNNASHFVNDGIRDLTRASWDAHVEPNLWAPLALIRDFAAQLPETGEGNVINMLDQRVWNPTPYFLSYTVSKMGLWALTQTLAMSLAPRIRVNAIGPGPTMKNERQSDAHFERQWRAIPLQRPTDPAEICATIRYILATRALTGQMIALDGGEHLGWAQPSRGVVPFE